MSKSEFFAYDDVLDLFAAYSQDATDEEESAIMALWDALKKKVITGWLVPSTENMPHATLQVGRLVYQHDGSYIYTNVIRKVIYDTSGPAFDNSAIGKSVFLTREAAEADMKGGRG